MTLWWVEECAERSSEAWIVQNLVVESERLGLESNPFYDVLILQRARRATQPFQDPDGIFFVLGFTGNVVNIELLAEFCIGCVIF